jgi:hypothetical protein
VALKHDGKKTETKVELDRDFVEFVRFADDVVASKCGELLPYTLSGEYSE